MTRAKVSTTKNGFERKAMWESGICPYCGSDEIYKITASRNVRGCSHPLIGVEYNCVGCGSKNVFTKR